MGIDKEIRKELIARYPRIVSEKPIDRAVPPHGQQWVEIEARLTHTCCCCVEACAQDVLTRLHSMIGPHYNYAYTGDELCETILAPAMELFRTGRVGTYVFCADEPSRVPREKAAEQQRRLEPSRPARRFAATNPEEAAARDAKRRCPPTPTSFSQMQRKADQAALERVYPADAVVVADGICYRPQLADGTRVAEPITEILHLPSLLRQRTARTSIWAYLATYLSRVNPMILMPGEIIIDHWQTGALRFSSDSSGAQQLSHLRHPFGEGEIMCMFWANYYAKCPRVIHSIDTDVLPLAVHLQTISAVADSGPLLWKYNATTHINLRLLTNLLLQKNGMTSHEFMVWCILCGADYFNKANVFAGYGCTAIRPWIVTTRNTTAAIVESLVSASSTATTVTEFDDKLSLFKAFVTCCRASAERKTKPPTDEQQAIALREFLFLYRYWSIRWNDFPRANDDCRAPVTHAESASAAVAAAALSPSPLELALASHQTQQIPSASMT